MKLHVFPLSPNARKAMMVNDMLDYGAEITPVDLQQGEQFSEAYLALNPNGKVPTLEFDDGTTLLESNVIMNRMASEKGSDLWPVSNQRYDILRWQFWEACHWTPACGKYISRNLFNNQSVDMEAAEKDFARFAKVLDDHLAGRDWLSGEAMTTADLAVAPILYLREPCRFPLDGHANIAKWLARIEALPSWKALPDFPG